MLNSFLGLHFENLSDDNSFGSTTLDPRFSELLAIPWIHILDVTYQEFVAGYQLLAYSTVHYIHYIGFMQRCWLMEVRVTTRS
jgi:hypothetical protein